jgi:RNA polymerase sigma-70 factor (ECF subfamily)
VVAGVIFPARRAEEVNSDRHEYRRTGNVDDLTALALAAGRGDSDAMAAFIRDSQREVRALCAYLVDPEAADDLAQETFLRAFRALPGFRGDSSARTWLLAIARRACMDELRRRSRRRRQEGPMLTLEDREPPAADDTHEIEVRELLSHLPEDRRTAFVLTQITGLSYEDAAHACGVPAGTIASRVARARTDLIEALGLMQAPSGGMQAPPGGPAGKHKVRPRPAWRRSARERLVDGETR